MGFSFELRRSFGIRHSIIRHSPNIRVIRAIRGSSFAFPVGAHSCRFVVKSANPKKVKNKC
jgi:hypothetical protein